MLRVLYVDTLFFVNFALDLLSFCFVGLLLHMEKKPWRILTASALSALYAVIAVLLAFPFLLQLLTSVLLFMLLLPLAYRSFGSLKKYLLGVGIFYFSSVLLGGAVEGAFSLIESLTEMRGDDGPRSSDLVLLFGFVTYGVLYLFSRFVSAETTKRVATVRVTLNGKSATFSLLVDSGCLLSDPLSGKPALLVCLEALSGILPGEITACARSYTATMPYVPQNARRCRLIPAEALGERRLLLCVRADELLLVSSRGRKRKERSLDAYIAILPMGKERFDGLEGLLPASLAEL